MADELDGMATFVAVAEAKGFRAAGTRLGVSGSAVSQALRRLEERLGVALVQRTTRSVRLTEAGERLYASVRPALEEVRAAVLAVGELADSVAGGYDAGIHLGEMIDQDMIAVPASGPQRLVVVGAPAYLARHGAPAH